MDSTCAQRERPNIGSPSPHVLWMSAKCGARICSGRHITDVRTLLGQGRTRALVGAGRHTNGCSALTIITHRASHQIREISESRTAKNDQRMCQPFMGFKICHTGYYVDCAALNSSTVVHLHSTKALQQHCGVQQPNWWLLRAPLKRSCSSKLCGAPQQLPSFM